MWTLSRPLMVMPSCCGLHPHWRAIGLLDRLAYGPINKKTGLSTFKTWFSYTVWRQMPPTREPKTMGISHGLSRIASDGDTRRKRRRIPKESDRTERQSSSSVYIRVYPWLLLLSQLSLPRRDCRKRRCQQAGRGRGVFYGHFSECRPGLRPGAGVWTFVRRRRRGVREPCSRPASAAGPCFRAP